MAVLELSPKHCYIFMTFSAFLKLRGCMLVIIQSQCGEDASLLYNQLVMAQVPAEVLTMCEPQEKEEEGDDTVDDDLHPANTNNSASHLSHILHTMPLWIVYMQCQVCIAFSRTWLLYSGTFMSIHSYLFSVCIINTGNYRI